MSRPTMTYKLAMAAGMDAANKRMHAQGRRTWDDADWQLACDVFEHCWPQAKIDRSSASALQSG